MNYRKLVRSVNTKDYYLLQVDPKLLYAQYNPERFHMWVSLHEGPPGEEFNMLYSPHYRLLKGNPDPYWKLQKMYGRGNQWITAKVKKFWEVCESIKLNGFSENISALEIPLVKNKYNNGLEIWEGHHRVSIALTLNINEIKCEIIRRRK